MASSSTAVAQDADPLAVTLPTGKVVHFQSAEQKAKYEAARAHAAKRSVQSPAPSTSGSSPIQTFSLYTGTPGTVAPTATLLASLDECVAKFGPATREVPDEKAFLKDVYSFEKKGFKIRAQFLDGQVAAVSYTRPEPFEDAEIQGLLDNNAGDASWVFSAADSEHENEGNIYRRCQCYYLSDKGAHAYYKEVGTYNGLFIYTNRFKTLTTGRSANMQGL